MQVEEGALSMLVTIEGSWPIAGLERTTELAGGRLVCSIFSDGSIGAAVLRDDSNIISLRSSPLIVSGVNGLLVIVSWKLPHNMFIHLSGNIVASTDPSHEIKTRIERAQSDNDIVLTDYSVENKAAIANRKIEAASRKIRPGRKQADNAYLYAALEAECAQVADLLQMISDGRKHHVFGLASRLRLLLARGRQRPLLQSCAAITDSGLLIYTGAPVPPMPVPASFAISHNVSATRSAGCSIITDIDVWLKMDTALIDGRLLTADEVLRSIGDTVGSHLDHDIDPAVAFLLSNKLLENGDQTNDLVKFIRRTAEAALFAANRIVNLHYT